MPDRLNFSETDAFELKVRREEDKQRKKRSELNRRRFAETKTARAGGFIKTLINSRKKQVTFARAISTPRRGAGRPFKSYTKRYAEFGGVYGYRKALSAERRSQRLQQLRESTISPQQEAILAQAAQRDRLRRTNPENQIIPDTSGRVPLRSIHDEISDAANIFP